MSAPTTAELIAWHRHFPTHAYHTASADRLSELEADRNEWEAHARRLLELVKTLVGREPQPTDGPDYHADHRAWLARIGPALAAPYDVKFVPR